MRVEGEKRIFIFMILLNSIYRIKNEEANSYEGAEGGGKESFSRSSLSSMQVVVLYLINCGRKLYQVILRIE